MLWGVLVISLFMCSQANAMARPKCNFSYSPASGHQRVRLVSSTLGNLTGLSAAETEAAILAAIVRVNQQNESNVYFTYDGAANARVRSNRGCGLSCDGLNTIDVVELCATPAYFERRCRDNTNGHPCGPINKWLQWAIVLCNSYVSDAEPLIVRPSGLSVGDDAVNGDRDLLTLVMHELLHAIGLHHPAVHLAAADEYCDGDPATMGHEFCGGGYGNHNPARDVHGLALRDLYRYDIMCAEERNGKRKLRVNRLSESGGVFSHSVRSVSGGASGVSVWQSGSTSRVFLRQGDTRTWRALGVLGTVLRSFTDDEFVRSRRTDSLGIAGGAGEYVASSENYSLTEDWHQVAEVNWKRGTSDFATVTSGTAKTCANSACTSYVAINAGNSVDYFDTLKPGNGRYGLWAAMSREPNGGDSSVVYIGKETSAGVYVFSQNLLDVRIESAVKPAIVCDERVLCSLFYVPLEDRLGRVHVRILLQSNTTGRFAPILGTGPYVVSTSTRPDFRTGSDLIAWRRASLTGGRARAFVAFVSNDVGFPVQVLELDIGGPQAVLQWSGSTGTSALSVSKDVPASGAAVEIVWLSP